jgi:hypothetical protein
MRCHKGGHIRADCKEPKAKWEDKFDKEKTQYWTSVLKWQQKAAEQNGSQKVPPKDTQPPTLHVKPDKRFNVFSAKSDSDDEPLYHYRLVMQDPDSDDEDYDMVDTTADATAQVIPAALSRCFLRHSGAMWPILLQ